MIDPPQGGQTQKAVRWVRLFDSLFCAKNFFKIKEERTRAVAAAFGGSDAHRNGTSRIEWE